jgi:membrane-bound ClpP family serine protease
MANIFGGLFSRVLRVRIEGNINQKLTDSIVGGLKKSFWVKPEAVVVTISSPGGSLTQAKNISDILKQYSNRNNVPIYTFA